jgi:hypothetical protein
MIIYYLPDCHQPFRVFAGARESWLFATKVDSRIL